VTLEPTNEDRADWAEMSITLFQTHTGVDRDDAASDLIANICHWMRREGMDPQAEIERALMHFAAEEEEVEE